MAAGASNLRSKQRKIGLASTVVDITPSSPRCKDGNKARLNTSIRTASTKSSTLSSSLSSYANTYLTGSLFDSERDESAVMEDIVSELTPSDYNVNNDTYEKKAPPKAKQSEDDDDDDDECEEVDHVGLILGGAKSINSNHSSNTFIEKIRSLEINEVHFEDVVAKKSKKVMDTYLNAFIDSHDHKSARRRSIQLLNEESPSPTSGSNTGSNSGSPVSKKKETKEKDDKKLSKSMKEKEDKKLSKSMNDIETKQPPVIISTTKGNAQNARKKDASHKEDKKSQHSRKQSRRKSNQLSHSMNDVVQSNWYNPIRKNRKDPLTRSMNDVSTNPSSPPPPSTEHTKPRRRQSRRKTVHFSKMDSGGDDDGEIQRTESDQSKIYVKHMPWTDHKGKGGDYIGEVNRLMQPHGRGVLKYKDGTRLEVTWVNGTPLEVDRPCASEAKPAIEGSNKKSRQSRRRSSTRSQQPPINLPGFHLGDVASPSDMVIEGDSKKALKDIKTLKVHDFAFVLRSDGVSWTYAAVANFYARRGKISSMRFLVDEMGSSKTIEKEDWAECIRMVNTEAYKSPSSSSRNINADCLEGPSPCSSEGAVKDKLSLDEVREFFEKAEVRRPRYIQLG